MDKESRTDCRKAYIVTQGCYSDYHICSVFLDKESAEKYVKLRSERGGSRYDELTIEQYDITEYGDIPNHYYIRVMYNPKDDSVKVGMIEGATKQRFDGKGDMDIVDVYWDGCLSFSIIRDYMVDINNLDKEHILKIARDKYAEYKAKREGIT